MFGPEEEKPCPCCNGRGYMRCDCWPGDCICGYGDETCEECDGDGVVWPDEYDYGNPYEDHTHD